MSTNNTRFTFEAQDNGVGSAYDNIRNKARSTFDELARGSQQYSSSSKEQVRFIEEEIRALDKKYLLQKKIKEEVLEEAKQKRAGSLQELFVQRAQGNITQSEYTSRKQSVESEYSSVEAQFDDLDELPKQTVLLKEMLESLRAQIREEIKSSSDEKNDLLRGTRSSDLEAGELGEGTTETLLRNVLRDKLNIREDQQDPDAPGGTNWNKYGSRGASVATQQNEFYMGAAIVGLFSVGAATLLTKMFSDSKALDSVQRRVETLSSGRGSYGRDGSVLSAGTGAGIGYSIAEVNDFAIKQAKALGSFARTTDPIDLMASGRAYDIDQGSILSLAKGTRRSTTSTFDILSTLGGINMSATGGYERMEELLQISNTLIEEQTKEFTKVDPTKDLQTINVLTKLGGYFGDTSTMSSTIRSFDQSIKNPKNDYTQALVYQVVQDLNNQGLIEGGIGGLADLQLATSKGIRQQGMLGGVLDRLIATGGGEQDARVMLSEMFGFSPDVSKSLYQLYQDTSQRENINTIGTSYSKLGLTREQIFGVASDTTAYQEQLTKGMSDRFAVAGKAATDFADNMEKAIVESSGFLDSLGKMKDAMSGFVKDLASTNLAPTNNNGRKGP